jgi:hypothetical protein
LEVSETAKAWLFCFGCSKLMAVAHEDDVIGWALLGRGVTCGGCGQAIDPWHVLVQSLKEPTPGASVPIGLRLTAIAYRLRMDRIKELDLEREGVPAGAQLLNVRHSASSDECRIVDLDANDSARQPSTKYNLLGVWRGQEPAPDDVQGWTMVLWAQHDRDDVARQQLVTALEALANGKLKDAIVPATVAVENPLSRAVDDYYQWIGVSNERRQSFLRDAATFSHQLNVLAPAIANHIGAPQLSVQLRGLLNRLRGLRNEVAHTGQVSKLDRDIAAECVAAAVFGFRYARLLSECLEFVRSGHGGEAKTENSAVPSESV